MTSIARGLVLTAILLALATTVSAQPDVLLEKFTNGQDADTAPGPFLIVGDAVTWTYEVTASGGRDLVNVVVTDDQGVVVTCPSTTVAAGATMICTANGVVVAGQYANVGTVDAELVNTTPVWDLDPSHYFGQAAAPVTIEKSTGGLDADVAPGPSLPVGSVVGWTYEVRNGGADPLTNIVVSDDQGVPVSCPAADLAAGASMTCTGSGVVQPGQYANIGIVTAELPSMAVVGDSDPSHYFGQSILIEKATNGQDADTVPGPVLAFNAAVTWTYTITNPGPETVANIAVTDDQGVVVSCPGTTLVAGEMMVCTANGTAQAGQYANIGTVTADLPLGGQVSDTDPSHYLGQVVSLEKSTNGQDADLQPGPVLAIGAAVDWAYEVTNLGDETLTNVAVTDDQAVVVTCPGTTLAAGESMTCTANGTALAGQYTNIGTVMADHPTVGAVSASDPSHYFGQDQVLDFGDVADPPYLTRFASNGARHLLGSGVYLGACVDSELDGVSSAAADGDDTGAGLTTFGTCALPGDDEDGVTFTTPITPGNLAGVDVVANEACTLSAWVDFNGDGDWTDAGEDIFPGGTALAAGASSLTFAVPLASTAGSVRARFRCTTDGAVSFAGEASDGEAEDYAVAVQYLDFGDAADPTYPTTFASGGARHVLGSSVFLGACVDAELDGVSSAAADGDDTGAGLTTFGTCAAPGDDEDGVTFTTPLAVGTTAGVDVVASSPCTLSAWVDFNADGDWTDAGEDVFPGGTALAAGNNSLTFPVPLAGVLGTTRARLRCTTGGAVSFDGEAADGEVEDYTVTITGTPTIVATKTAALDVDVMSDGDADGGDTLLYTVTITNNGTAPANGVTFTDNLDPNTALVAGSVTTTQGAVPVGNGAGDISVAVNVGVLAPAGSVTITYQAVVANPVPPGVTQVVNQGIVSGADFPDTPTDDPAATGAADATVVAVSAAASIPATSGWALAMMALLIAVIAVRRIA